MSLRWIEARAARLLAALALVSTAALASASDYAATLSCGNSGVAITSFEVWCSPSCGATFGCPGGPIATYTPAYGMSCAVPGAFPERSAGLTSMPDVCSPNCPRTLKINWICYGVPQLPKCLTVPEPGSGGKVSVTLPCAPGILPSDSILTLQEAVILNGPGGAVPPSGSGGSGAPVWPTTLPSAASILLSPLAVDVPGEAERVIEISIAGLTHTWAGDLQIVLVDPFGNAYDLVHRLGFTGSGFGYSCDFGGEYILADGGAPWPSPTCSGTIPPGRYGLSPGIGAGAWPSGASGIHDRALADIAAVPGTWTLEIIDWAGGDVGSITGWSMMVGVADAPATYCVAGTTSSGCAAAITASANPSLSVASACTVSISSVEGMKTGIVFYGVSGPKNGLWCSPGASYLCVTAPTQRTPAQSSGGTSGTCDGTFALDWDAYQASHPAALGTPWSSGDRVYVQGWFRDPLSCKSTALSDALMLVYQP